MSDEAVPISLTLAIENTPDATIVLCRGRLVAGETDLLYTEVRPLFTSGGRVVLDLTDLIQMDSMGLGTLIRLLISARSGNCELELVNLGPRIRQLLGMTNLLSFFTVIGENNIRLP